MITSPWRWDSVILLLVIIWNNTTLSSYRTIVFFWLLICASRKLLSRQHIHYWSCYLLWEIITPLLIILAFILSIPLKSKSFLYLGAIFLLLYICDSATRFIPIFGHMGWSLVLIVLGLLLMMIGYAVIYLHQK